MTRPASIVRFEQLYLGSLAVVLINSFLNYGATMEAMRSNPQTAAFATGAGMGTYIFGILVMTAITLVLWFLTARQGNAITKWIITVLAGLQVLGLIWGLLMAGMAPVAPSALNRILQIVALALDVASVYYLFRPDTRAWFGEKPAGVTPPIDPSL
jgi:hypothetical protein